MKKVLIKVLAATLAICTLVSCVVFTSSAETYVTYRTGANAAHANYKSSNFYKNLMKVPLTGDGRTDVVAVALSQVGYEEANSLTGLGGTSGGSNNYTEYCYNMGDWGSGYGGSSYAWCATFVAWALYQSRCSNQMGYSYWCRNHTGDSSYIWCEVSCSQWANQLRRYGYFKYSAQNGGTYKPQPGDLIFFDWAGGSSGEDHIGIVVYSDSSKVYTIEGNTSDSAGLEDNGGGAYFKSYSLSYGYITGYGVLPYKTNSSVPDIDYSGANPTPGLYMATNSSKYVYPTETSTSYSHTIPKYSMFEVTDIASNGMLKVKATISGSTVTGYIKNNSDRVVQISTTQIDGLSDAMAAAEAIYYGDYSENILAQIRSKYAEAKTLSASASATYAQKKACADALNALVARKGEGTLAPEGVYITGYNTKIKTENCNIFTPSFGTITATAANHKWTYNVIAKWDTKENAYLISSITSPQGENIKDVTLASDEILIAIHVEGATTATHSDENYRAISKAKVGDKLTFYGTDPKTVNSSVGMYFTFETIAVPGDLDGDKQITTTDFLMVRKHVSGKNTLTSDYVTRADLDSNGAVNTTDLVILRKKLANKQ